MLKNSLIAFLKHESAVGVLLIIATFMAMVMANTSFKQFYDLFLNIPVVVSIGEFIIAKPLLLWINDGLMAVFFFMVGLEIKREVLEGNLNHLKKIAVPAFAAVGGMVVPAMVYAAFNWDNGVGMSGWAVPMATDIAFALGVLSLLGRRVPLSLKVFLLTLAIIDDLGAIIVIALFYAKGLSLASLGIAAFFMIVMIIMNSRGVVNNTIYILLGIMMWVAVLKSGVHATLAGVILGLLIPLKNNKASFHRLEHSLHVPVNLMVLPLFAFVNTGVSFDNTGFNDIFDKITVGIAAGLFIGKQVGVFAFGALAVYLGLGRLPDGMKWGHLYGIALLSGIGFTMSLFIGSLAFECSEGVCISLVDERMGILIGSLLSGVTGYLVLRWQFGKPE